MTCFNLDNIPNIEHDSIPQYPNNMKTQHNAGLILQRGAE